MNVITTYLDTMFSPYPQTSRLLEARTELQAMMEDAYANLTARGLSHNEAIGKVITDFGNLDELAPVLGIASEIAPSVPTTSPHPGAAGATTQAIPAAPRQDPVTLEEAQGFAEAHRRTRFRLSTAVALFVISPISLIVLTTASEAGLIPIEQNLATFLGLLLLFLFVAVGVVMIIGLSREFTPFNRLREGRFSRNPVVTSWAEDLAQQHERSRTAALQIAVLCWVLSPVPLLLLSLLLQNSPVQGFWSIIGVAATLVLVAIGLLVLLPATWAHTVAETLTSGGAASQGEEPERSLIGVIAAFYWPLLTAIFLAWSFIGNAWGQSWIVWPVGGVLFAAIAAGVGAFESYRKSQQR